MYPICKDSKWDISNTLLGILNSFGLVTDEEGDWLWAL